MNLIQFILHLVAASTMGFALYYDTQKVVFPAEFTSTQTNFAGRCKYLTFLNAVSTVFISFNGFMTNKFSRFCNLYIIPCASSMICLAATQETARAKASCRKSETSCLGPWSFLLLW